MAIEDTSFAFRFLGHRSLLSWLFGTFFSNRSNTSGVLAVVLLGAVIYFYGKNGSMPDQLFNALMVSLGFYFGGSRAGQESATNGRELP